MSKATLAILSGLVFIIAAASIAILLARGYQFDPGTKEITSTGILVATSDPNGAQVFIDNKLTTATDTTINLKPGVYNVRISKDGFNDWQKSVTIKREEVFKTNAFLFPKASDLRPITFDGALNPIISPDQTRIVYGVASASALTNGVWVLDMTGGRPVFGGGDFRQIFRDTVNFPLSYTGNYFWSDDNRQLVASVSSGLQYLLNADQINPSLAVSSEIRLLTTQWDLRLKQKLNAQLSKLPNGVLATIATSSANWQFSPDETRLLYTATSSATLPSFLTNPLPGSNPTPEIRQITAGNLYVYDMKEDKNYLITAQPQAAANPSILKTYLPTNTPILWFPTSRHLLSHTDKEISIMEFDGTNKSVVYSGPFMEGFVYPWPNASKIVILTSLNPSSLAGANLYTINLR